MGKMMLQDKVLVRTFGVGLKLLEMPEISLMNLDLRFFESMSPRIVDGRLEVPVTHEVPAKVMGSGLGANQVYSGDYDIQLFDQPTLEKYGLEDLRLGDLVAILDADHTYGRIYKEGAISIGMVVHTNCVTAGHGPGVATLMTSAAGKIRARIDAKANIAELMKLRKP